MPHQLTITMDDNGNVQVQGPINNRSLAYGMLGAARDAIYDHLKTQAASVQPPTTAELAKLKLIQ